IQTYAAMAQQSFQQAAKAADADFDGWAATQDPPERVKEVSAVARKVLRDVGGLSDEQIAHAWATDANFRSAGFQRILYMASKWQMSKDGLAQKVHRPVPTVQRPGSPAEIAAPSDYEYRRLSDKLDNSTGSDALRAAAELVTARRARRR